MEAVSLSNQEQSLVYDKVIQKIESNEGSLFFFDALGGTGKTFLLNLPSALIRKVKELLLQ